MGKQRRIPPMPRNIIPVPGAASIDDIVRRQSVPDDISWDPENPLTVNKCSGSSEEHIPSCDGDCEKMELQEIDVKIENENRAWARAGFKIQAYQSNQFRQDIQIQILMDLVREHLELSEEDFNQMSKKLVLERMQKIRSENEEAVKSAQIMKGIALPGKPLH